MNDFNKRFNSRRDEFDRDFDRMKRWGAIAFIFNAIIGLGLLGFTIWVIVMILQFFGVI